MKPIARKGPRTSNPEVLATRSYYYDAFGQRVRKVVGSEILDTQYDIEGRPVAYGNTVPSFVTWQDFLYAGNRFVGFYGAGTRFAHPDNLGSSMHLTNQIGTETQDELYYPWGVRWQTQGTVEDERFAGLQRRDAESGLDPTPNRMYTSSYGRWMTPDPAGLAVANPSNPQSWNRYAYALNNPATLTDPLGLGRCVPGAPNYENDCQPPSGEGYTGVDPNGCGADDPECDGGFGPIFGVPPEAFSQSDHPGGGGGSFLIHVTSTSTYPRAGQSRGVASCASDFAEKISIANGLHALGIGTSGVGGFITKALGGNMFSGATDLYESFKNGSAGGHSVFYNMGQGVLAGPSQGVPGLRGPWGASASDLATGAIAGAYYNAVTGAGETLTTLSGEASLSLATTSAAEFASGVGIAKFVYDSISYGVGLLGCREGVIQ